MTTIHGALSRRGLLAAEPEGAVDNYRPPHVPRHERVVDTASSVVRLATTLGWGGSGTCRRIPVSVPRLSFLEMAA